MENSRARSIVDAIMKSTESTELSTEENDWDLLADEDLLAHEDDEEIIEDAEDIKASILKATIAKMKGGKLGSQRD